MLLINFYCEIKRLFKPSHDINYTDMFHASKSNCTKWSTIQGVIEVEFILQAQFLPEVYDMRSNYQINDISITNSKIKNIRTLVPTM